MSRRRVRNASLAAILLLSGFAAAVVIRSFGSPALPSAPLQIPQGVSASSVGIDVSISSAEFSGTGTLLRVTVSASEGSSVPVDQTQRVTVPRDGFAAGSLTPWGATADGITLSGKGSQPSLVRLSPVRPGESPQVHFQLVDLWSADGVRTRITGDWQMVLKTPDNLVELLRTEQFGRLGSAEANGLTVVVEGAARSTSETTVSVRLIRSGQPAAIDLLAQPELDVDGRRVAGTVASQAETVRR